MEEEKKEYVFYCINCKLIHFNNHYTTQKSKTGNKTIYVSQCPVTKRLLYSFGLKDKVKYLNDLDNKISDKKNGVKNETNT